MIADTRETSPSDKLLDGGLAASQLEQSLFAGTPLSLGGTRSSRPFSGVERFSLRSAELAELVGSFAISGGSEHRLGAGNLLLGEKAATGHAVAETQNVADRLG